MFRSVRCWVAPLLLVGFTGLYTGLDLGLHREMHRCAGGHEHETRPSLPADQSSDNDNGCLTCALLLVGTSMASVEAPAPIITMELHDLGGAAVRMSPVVTHHHEPSIPRAPPLA